MKKTLFKELGERITFREMRGVRYGLVRHGLLLLPSEVLGDFCKKHQNPHIWSQDLNVESSMISDEYPMSLVDMMLNSVRLFGRNNVEENSEYYAQNNNNSTRSNVNSSNEEIRIVLFAVLQGIILMFIEIVLVWNL